MEAVVLVLMVLVCFNYVLKQTYRKLYSVVFSAAVCALFVGLSWPYAIEQSKSQLSDWLADTALMLDLSVVLSVEVGVQMAFCLLAAHMQTSDRLPRHTVWAYRLLRWFPGLLIFPLLFGGLVLVIFALPGCSFATVAWMLGGVVFGFVPLARYLLLKLLPEKDIRLELLFLSQALTLLLGVVATVNGRTAVAGVSEVDPTSLLGVCLLVLTGGCGGWLLQVRHLKKKINKQVNKTL